MQRERPWAAAPSPGSAPAGSTSWMCIIHLRVCTHSSCSHKATTTLSLLFQKLHHAPRCNISQENPSHSCPAHWFAMISVLCQNTALWQALASLHLVPGTRNSPFSVSPPSSATLQPPVYDLSMPDLPICPLIDADAGVNLLFLNIPFPRVDTVSIMRVSEILGYYFKLQSSNDWIPG